MAEISIHAPTRGATGRVFVATGFYHSFQSTLPRGERQILVLALMVTHAFQSTLPRGERPAWGEHFSIVKYFNPRSHEGSDIPLAKITVVCGISIHAPTRGATNTSASMSFGLIFQSTLPRGERLKCTMIHELLCNFNPRSHEGSDGKVAELALGYQDFNPRSHEGSDRCL